MSYDGRSLLAWGVSAGPYNADRKVHLFDLATAQERVPGMAHAGEVRGAVFSGDDRRVFTWGDRGGRLWDAETGNALGPAVELPSIVAYAAFTAGGDEVVASGPEDERWTVDVGPGDLDLPPDLFGLQARVLTGTAMGARDQQLQILSIEDWELARQAYLGPAQDHALTCRFPAHNAYLGLLSDGR
jgi:hypothetical protein